MQLSAESATIRPFTNRGAGRESPRQPHPGLGPAAPPTKGATTLPTTNYEPLRQAIAKFKELKVLVIGDIIIDHFIWGSVNRISPEAPVPVVNVTHENLLLGGSANVLHNIYALGGQATICGIVGDDAMGAHLLKLLEELPSPTAGVIKVADRPTTKKTRVIAQHQQVVRFDREKTANLNEEQLAAIKRFLTDHLQDFSVVIVSDYAKGMITEPLMTFLRAELAKHPEIPLVVDPKPKQPERFVGTTLITPNHHEAELMSGIAITDEESLLRAGHQLQTALDSKAVLITRGEAGMALFEKDKPVFAIPTVAKEVYDVTGAGDTVIATLALGLAAGLTFAEAATLANQAAGIVVGKLGTATASRNELLELLA